MKLYVQSVQYCNECPNIRYTHFDGEGECVPYQYEFAYCDLSKKYLVSSLIVGKIKQGYRENNIPIRKIPDWCELKDYDEFVNPFSGFTTGKVTI